MTYFGRELARILGGEAGQTIGGYSATNLNGTALYVDGVSKLLTITEQSIRLLCGKVVLAVSGERLVLDEASLDTVVIRGKIISCCEESL